MYYINKLILKYDTYRIRITLSIRYAGKEGEMDWINEPEEGVAPACGNCFFYAHGGCTKRCPNQSCTFRF